MNGSCAQGERRERERERGEEKLGFHIGGFEGGEGELGHANALAWN